MAKEMWKFVGEEQAGKLTRNQRRASAHERVKLLAVAPFGPLEDGMRLNQNDGGIVSTLEGAARPISTANGKRATATSCLTRITLNTRTPNS